MRKLMIVAFVAAAAVISLFAAPGAQAQQYPDVSGLTAFTPEANFMSLAGYLRWRHFQATGQWISRDEAVQAVEAQMGGGAATTMEEPPADLETPATEPM